MAWRRHVVPVLTLLALPGCFTFVAFEELGTPGHDEAQGQRVVELLGLAAHIDSAGAPVADRARVRLASAVSPVWDLHVSYFDAMALDATCEVTSDEPLGSWASPFIVIEGPRPQSIDVRSTIGRRVLADGSLGKPSPVTLDEARIWSLAFFDVGRETLTLSCFSGLDRSVDGEQSVKLGADQTVVYSLPGHVGNRGPVEPALVNRSLLLFLLVLPLTVALDVATLPIQGFVCVLIAAGGG
jgi:hypothetical protein